MSELSRRTFIKLSVLSSAVAAGISGCKNEQIWKEEATGQYGGMSNKVYPYVNQPGETIDGVPVYYASTCQMCSAGCGIYVRTLGGRANKIEGNPYHPVNLGKTCLRGQLALQHLYNPDRLMFPVVRQSRSDSFERASWDTALAAVVNALSLSKGRTAILVDGVTVLRSPSKMSLVSELVSAADATFYCHSIVDEAPWIEASKMVYGKAQIPDYRLDRADLIISFGGNFLEEWPSPVHYGQLFGEFRQGARRSAGNHGTFIYIGPRMSMTAAKADIWVPCNPGAEGIVARALRTLLGGGSDDEVVPAASASGVDAAQIARLAAMIRKAGPNFVAIGGDGLYTSPDVTKNFVEVELLNVAAKSICVDFGKSMRSSQSKVADRSLITLVQDMSQGKVDNLILIGAVNPAFSLPDSLSWPAAVEKVRFTAAIAHFLDDTSSSFDVALPARTFLEEWGDFVPSVLPGGTNLASITQPVIDPQYITHRHQVDSNGNPVSMMDTRETSDIIIDLLASLNKPSSVTDSLSLVRKQWSAIGAADLKQADFNNDVKWIDTVSSGGKWEATQPVRSRSTGPGQSETKSLPIRQPGFQLLLYPHIYFGDGRHTNLNWVQEMPDPMTGAIWNSWVEINATVAHDQGIRTGDIVRLSLAGRHVDLPAIPSQAIHPDAVAVPIGQGHASYGRNASSVGTNPLKLIDIVADTRTGALAFSASSVSITRIASAASGYHPELNTLVLVQDRPGGQEPPAVKDLIHETAREWLASQNGSGAELAKPERARPIL